MPQTLNIVRHCQHSFRAMTASALLASAGLASPALADVWSWNTGNGNWTTASNWSSGTVPGVNALVYTDVRIGNLPGVQNSTVLMDQLTLGAWPFDELHISSGMTLDMNGRELGGLNAIATLTGANSELIVRHSAGPNFHDFNTGELTMGAGTLLNLADNGRIRTGYLTSAGVIFGRGSVHVQGSAPGASLVNNGTISGSGNGGLAILQEGSGRLDLDGASGNGQLALAAPFSQLTFEGDQLADAFSGTVTMGSGSLLNMNMSSGWTADSISTFNVASGIVGAAAQIDGGHFTFGGDLNIGGSQGHLRMLADATFTSTADVFLGADDRLEFGAAATVQGGVYALSSGARIDFEGATSVGGGTFNMVGNLPSQGSVNFNGNTHWSGTVNANGYVRQNGDAAVASPATINANVLDMDGGGESTWTINQALVVNTQAIEQNSQQFDGTINMNGSLFGRLTLNLSDPKAAWTMNGTMNLAGFAALAPVRVAGSRMIVTGELSMGTGIARISADTSLQGAAVSIAGGGTLRMLGATTIDAGATFAGTGTLENGDGGSMLLNSGASLGTVGLINDSALRIGESGPGVASVDRFTNTANGLLGIDIGGHLAGTEHDLLIVAAGPATLDGMINVRLIGLGGGTVFAPSIGDEFTVLSALGGISGAFVNDPTSQVNGLIYEWSVIYNPNTVVLRLDTIVPAPGCTALLGLGGLVAARRRRS